MSMTPKLPTPGTLNKYGLTAETFTEILNRQYGVCAICGKVPNGHWCIDHEHVKNWKNKPPEERAKYVRGIVCWFCNHYYIGKGITIDKAKNVVKYLVSYQERKTA